MNNSKLGKMAWIGFCLFALGYVGNLLLSLSNDLRNENFILASLLLGLFSVVTIAGIILPAKSVVKDNEKIVDLEKRLKKLEDERSNINS